MYTWGIIGDINQQDDMGPRNLWKSGDPEIWVFDQQRIGQVALNQTTAGLHGPRDNKQFDVFLNMATNG